MFGDDEVNDDALLKAMRKRLLDEISSRGQSERIVNNVYGSSPSGLVDRLNQDYYQGAPAGSGEEDPYEYMVDIDREDKIGPDGEKIGWNKKVHRYRKKKIPTS